MKKLINMLVLIVITVGAAGFMSACTERVVQPSAPENLQWDMESWTISWDEAENAESYKLITDETDEVYETSETEYNFEHILVTDSTNTISICAVSADGLTSEWVQLQVETETPTEALVYTMLDDGLGYEVTRMYSNFTGLEGRVVIADYYDGLPVKSIADTAFGKLYLGLENDVTTSYHLPKYLESIESRAFCENNKIEEIKLPDTVTTMGISVFSGCENLSIINIPLNLTKIPMRMLCYTTITELVVPDHIVELENYAFQFCTNLTKIIFPEKITIWGNNICNGCTSLESVTLPENITEIPNSMFQGCTSLTEITIPQNVTSIGNSAFSGTNLTEIDIPQNVTSIGTFAFYKSSLTEITIPQNVTAISDYTFCSCTSLKSIVICGDITTIGKRAFDECTALECVYYNGTAEGWSNIEIGEENDVLTEDIIYFYSEAEPALNGDGTAYDGNFWHYDENGNPVAWVL